MDIMEQIKTNFIKVAENTTKVYQAGYNKGDSDGYERGHGEGLTAGYENGYNVGFEEGKQSSSADYDEAYNDGYQAGYTDGEFLFKKIYGYQDLFHFAIFPDGYELELHLNSGHSFDLTSLFHNAQGLKRIKLIGGDSKVCRCGNMCHTVTSLETFDISELNIKISVCTNFFLAAKKLKTVIGEFDLTDCTSTLNFFNGCSALEEVRFKKETIKLSISFAQSSLLSTTSIQSIIDGLATVTTAQTITFHGSIVLSDEQKATISSKGWTLAQ